MIVTIRQPLLRYTTDHRAEEQLDIHQRPASGPAYQGAVFHPSTGHLGLLETRAPRGIDPLQNPTPRPLEPGGTGPFRPNEPQTAQPVGRWALSKLPAQFDGMSNIVFYFISTKEAQQTGIKFDGGENQNIKVSLILQVRNDQRSQRVKPSQQTYILGEFTVHFSHCHTKPLSRFHKNPLINE